MLSFGGGVLSHLRDLWQAVGSAHIGGTVNEKEVFLYQNVSPADGIPLYEPHS